MESTSKWNFCGCKFVCSNQTFLLEKKNILKLSVYRGKIIFDLLVLTIRQKHSRVRCFYFLPSHSCCRKLSSISIKKVSHRAWFLALKFSLPLKAIEKATKEREKKAYFFFWLFFSFWRSLQSVIFHLLGIIFNTFNIFLFHFVWFMIFSFVLTELFKSEKKGIKKKKLLVVGGEIDVCAVILWPFFSTLMASCSFIKTLHLFALSLADFALNLKTKTWERMKRIFILIEQRGGGGE